jgi:transcriptional regulator with XRE-family HTH domain
MFDLRKFRKKFNIKQKDISTFLGVTQGNFSKWENEGQQPSFEMLIKIAEYFGITTDELLGREPVSPPCLTPEQQKLLQDYGSLPLDEQKAVRMIVESMVEARVKNKV